MSELVPVPDWFPGHQTLILKKHFYLGYSFNLSDIRFAWVFHVYDFCLTGYPPPNRCCLPGYHCGLVLFDRVSTRFDTQSNRKTQLRYPGKQKNTAQIPSQTALSPADTQSNSIVPCFLTGYLDYWVLFDCMLLWYPVKPNRNTQANRTQQPRYPVKQETVNLDTRTNRTIFNTLSNSTRRPQIPRQTAFFSA